MKNEKSRRSGRATTLSQVAKQAGVHPVTASRALNGDERVATATRENIQRIAREMNFTPSSAARALVMGRTETIAVATGVVCEHYYAQILHLMEAELTASNYKMLVLRSRDLNHDLLTIVSTNAVDGVIAIDAFPTISELVLSEKNQFLPCVYAGDANTLWDADTSAVDTVKIDMSEAVDEGVQAMLDAGCRRIAYVAACHPMTWRTEVRSRVYQEKMEAIGRASELINLEIVGNTANHRLACARFKEYVQKHGCPDGVLCQNDEIAISVYRALRDLGLRVPEDAQIVGCDGLDYMDYFDPPLSTIEQPAAQMCAQAWQFLQNRLNDPSIPLQRATLKAHLRARPSLKASSK